jgi:hypothetical protein
MRLADPLFLLLLIPRRRLLGRRRGSTTHLKPRQGHSAERRAGPASAAAPILLALGAALIVALAPRPASPGSK